jgi:hypothetical protein
MYITFFKDRTMGFQLQEQKSDGTYQTVADTNQSSYYNSESSGTEYGLGNTPVGPSLSESLATGPLSALFKSKYNYDRLGYPADLGSSGKGHMVQFDVYNTLSTDIKDVSTFLIDNATKASAAATAVYNAGVGGTVQNLANQATQAWGQSVELYNSLAQKGVEGALNQVVDSVVGKQTVSEFLQTRKEHAKTIYLYMPDTLDFTYSASWDKTDLMKAAGAVPVVGGLARGITSIMGNDAVKLAMNKFGYAFNPQSQMLFEGIDFRTYSMTFVFTPRSVQEAGIVKEIIKIFRMYAAPTVVNEIGGFFFKPPGIFGVSFFSDGAPNYNINKLMDSVLESVEVNYAPNGWSAHRDGKPVQTTITLSFKEMTLVDRTKIENGY